MYFLQELQKFIRDLLLVLTGNCVLQISPSTVLWLGDFLLSFLLLPTIFHHLLFFFGEFKRIFHDFV